jgi:dephospho-CoA kinase
MFHQQTKPLIVLLSGWAGSGKDAAAALMVEEMCFIRHAFADSLKHDVATRTGIPVATFHSYVKNKPLTGPPPEEYQTAKTPRDILIQHAAAMRSANPNIYAEHVAADILTSQDLRHVISDWRYPNEYQHICETTGSAATVLRGRIVRSSVAPLDEETEHYLDAEPMDFVIQNDGSISDLRDSIRAALHSYMHPHN